MKTIILKSENLLLEFNSENGALMKVTAVKTGWAILDRPLLGLSFRMLLPMPEKRNNPVYGEKQLVTTVSHNEENITFFWDGVTSEFGGMHDIKIWLKISVMDKQIVFAMTIKNNSGFTVENVYCPYFGDVRHPHGEEWFKAFMSWYSTAVEWQLWPGYQNTKGYFGVDHPVQFAAWPAAAITPMSPYCILRSANQGLYAGIHAISNEAVAWHTELRPGFSNSINSMVPEESSIGGKEVSTRFAAVHVPYIMPGETCDLTPIGISAYQGDWQKGVDIYKEWRDMWFKAADVPRWAKEPHSWIQLHINSPEDELRMRFTELIKVGEECVRHGVKAIQLVGWNQGGQDQGNPSHDPDPRLGTFDELKEAITKIKAMGVKVVLFSKFTWADRATKEFREDLIKLSVKDPYGDYYMHQGYQYQTATQLLDINTKRLIPMCFLSDDYLEICKREFLKTVELGADGILFDECMHHGPALLCFDPTHGHRYGAPVYANDRKLIEVFSDLPGVPEDFIFSGEACYDWEFEVYHLSYHRSWDKEHIPLSRYMQPDMPHMTAITGFNDRNMINQCLLYKYIISYEPYHFKGSLEDYPLTLEYGKMMDAIRAELRDYFWDGTFKGTCGARVTTKDGRKYTPYAVFVNNKTGETGVVIANYDNTTGVEICLEVDNGRALSRYRLVDGAEWRDVVESIVIPPLSAVVVV